MLIPILLGAIGLVCLGFSIFLYRRYKENHKFQIFIFFMFLLLTSLYLIMMALKYANPN